MWEQLGFRHSPYDANPLRPVKEDVELLVGRDEQGVEFCTVLESAPQGIYVLSGSPGVGKTSFFNVYQYLLESGNAAFGPRLLAGRRLCPIDPKDSKRDVALRALHALYSSVAEYCAINKLDVPKQTKKVGEWLGGKGSSGFSVGLDILGFGGHFWERYSITERRYGHL